MSTPLRDDQKLNRREEMTVSTAALAEVPWTAAGIAGAVVTGADLIVHLIGGHLALASSLSAGVVALFAVAGASVVVRRGTGRAARWARNNPWRFALLPGAATAAIVFVLSVVFGHGLFGDVFTALWHGAISFGITGVAGTVAGGGRDSAARRQVR